MKSFSPNLSKSRYTLFRQCPKALWLNNYKPNEAVIDEATKARFEAGNVVGDMAMGYLGLYEEVTVLKPDGSLDLAEMIRRTPGCRREQGRRPDYQEAHPWQ